MILSLEHLNLSLNLPQGGKKQILHDVSFEIPKGSVTGFVGVNGAGKTTSIKAILGFLNYQSGQINYFGEPGLTANVKERLGYLPERPYFYEYLTGREFLGFHWELQGKKKGPEFLKREEEVLKSVDLERGRHTRLRQYSKGMLQRIGIAQAILHRPDFLILDEPMSGLDPDGRQLIKSIMRDLSKSGTTLFFSSHLLQDMEELCDRLVIIDAGKIIFSGRIGSLLDTQVGDVEIAFRLLGQESIQHEKVPSANLQNRIDELRRDKNEILWIARPQVSLEQAFQILRGRKEKS